MGNVNIKPDVEIRERRLHSVTNYQGDGIDLNEKGKELLLKDKDVCYGQCSQCQEGCAFGELYAIHDSSVISHAPIGCYATISRAYLSGRSVVKARGKDHFEHNSICTNISEKDTIYGAAEKLKDTIREADKRYHNPVVFVTSSCASGIIGDDISSVAAEMSEELGIKVSPVSCEGFKSKVWSTGFDAAFNALIRDVVEPASGVKSEYVNIFNFEGSDTFSPLLNPLGLKVRFLPAQASVEEFKEISNAVCTSTICETLATYAGALLEREYGVPQVKSPSPYGIDWTDNWVREVAKIAGKSDEAEEFIEKEHERIRPRLEELRKELAGKKVYIFAGDAFAHNMGSITSDLGMELVGVTTYHHDQKFDSPINTLDALVQKVGNIQNYSVCTKNPYQVLKFLKKLKPDILIERHQDLAILGYKLGIPTIFEADSNLSAGYNGIIEMGERMLRAFKTRKLVTNLAEHVELPYSDWWLNEDTDPFYFA